MKFLRPVVTVLVLLLAVGGALVWWNLPGRADLTEYAPADAIVYIEVNSVTDIVDSLSSSDVWKKVSIALKGEPPADSNHWFRSMARAGIGPARGVMLTRSQLALIVLNMNTTEENESLKVKPEFAIVAETHTSNWRTKPVAKDAVRRLATMIYGNASCADRNNGGVELFECGGATPDRKIVAAIEGSLIVVGNTEKAVQACLDVRRGARASLKTNAELQQARAAAGSSLAFGYVPRTNAPKLFAWAAPVVLGSEGTNTNLQKLLENSLAKMVGSISWTARVDSGQIEDTFVFGLEPDLVSQLQPVFVTKSVGNELWGHLPASLESMSVYRSQNPLTAWDALNTSVALKLDAVQSVVIGTVLRAGLTPYGISNPREFLGTVETPLITATPQTAAEGPVLIARIAARENLRRYLKSEYFAEGKARIVENGAGPTSGDAEFTAILQGDWLIVGRTANVAAYQTAIQQSALKSDSKVASLFSSANNSAGVLTWTKDRERVESFVKTLLAMENYQLTPEKGAQLNQAIGDDHFSFTQTSLTSSSLERRTRSVFGQFSTLSSVLSR